MFRTPDSLAGFFDKGVSKLLVAAPVHHQSALNIVYGVNEKLYNPDIHQIIRLLYYKLLSAGCEGHT